MITTFLAILNLIAPISWSMRYLLIGPITLLFAYPVQAQLVAPNEAGVTFGHIHLNVSDIELHAKLWTELFDGALVKKGALTGVSIPGVLIFFKQGEPTAPSQETVIDNIGLKVRDMDAILSEWQMLGYETESEFVDASNMSHACITLPNGTSLALEEDPALSAKAEMSHVHYATPQYRELVTWYADLFWALPQHAGEIEAMAYLPGTILYFNKSEEDMKPTENTAIDPSGVEVEDMGKFAEMLQTQGVNIELVPRYVESIDLWILFFTDPSGARIEVTEGLDDY
jgi:catechol 2,3-dioxygenase-like lactoylglutathione lyase family enzyme